MSKLKKDCHGFVVRVNGGYYRPEKSIFGYPIANRIEKTAFNEGDEVKVANVSQSPFCRVKRGNETEIWVYHGATHHGNLFKRSEECWAHCG